MKKLLISAVLIAAIAAGGYFGYNSINHCNHQLSDLMIKNIEALSTNESGQITVVGCKPMKNATCYVFDGNNQLVD